MKNLFPKSISLRKKPVNYVEKDEHLFIKEFKKEIEAINLHYLNDVFVNEELYIFKKYKILAYSYPPYSRAVRLSIFRRVVFHIKNFLFRKTIKVAANTLFVIDDWSLGYFHWFGDTLPRIVAFQESTNEKVAIILPKKYEKYTYVVESLKLLGIENIIFVLNQHIYNFDRLYFITKVSTGNYNTEVLNILRHKLQSSLMNSYNYLTFSQYKRVYISRAKADKRKVMNEADVVSLLESYGFVSLCFEDINWQEQAAISLNTQYLVSIHGAGMVNMLFMEKKTSVLELRREDDTHNNCYFALASALDIEYYYQVCEADSENTNQANFYVDILDLEKNIKLMLSNG